MNDVFNNQIQLAASVINLQANGISVDANLHQLGEVTAMNALPTLETIKTELEELV
jgi:hypothetical protein